jgi:hypothetical protein
MPSDAELPRLPNGEFDKRDLDRMGEVLRQPVNEAHGHGQIEVEQRFEAIEPSPNGLDDDRSWFILGLAYCLIKIDRSLMEAYQYSLGQSLRLKTHQAARPLIDVNGSTEWPANPWSGIIQGIERQHAQAFVNYLESYKFHRRDTGQVWQCQVVHTAIADPFSQAPRKLMASVALPCNTTLRRALKIVAPAFGAAPPLVGMVSVAND